MEALQTRIEQFNNWATERIAVLETCYEGLKVPLNYRLNRKESVHKDIFTNCFESAYLFINEEIGDATWRAKEADVPEKVLETAIKAFKALKAKVRKEKAEYRRAIEELQETLKQSVEDEAYIQESEKRLQTL